MKFVALTPHQCHPNPGDDPRAPTRASDPRIGFDHFGAGSGMPFFYLDPSSLRSKDPAIQEREDAQLARHKAIRTVAELLKGTLGPAIKREASAMSAPDWARASKTKTPAA